MKTIYACILLLGIVQAQYAVSSVHNDCGSQCQTNTTCCGSDSYCAGNSISQRCCPTGSGFCGCISNRGFCSGSVFNSTNNVEGKDSFGACYDQSTASCTYNPSPNLWIVCPKDYTACESASFYSCCDSDSVCTTNQASSYPICAPKSAASSSAPAATQSQQDTSSNSGLAVPSQNPQCQSDCPSSNNTCCDCCQDGGYCAGNDISRRCCPANTGFCGCISDRAFCSGSVYNSSGSVSGQDSFGTCFDSSSGATCTYNPNPNLWIVCPKDYTACESNSFFSCCGPDSVCTTTTLDSYPICAPKNAASSSTGNQQPAATGSAQSNCPSPLKSCGDACYSETEYCCPNGVLTQKSFCSTNGNSASSSTPASSTPACTSVSTVSQSSCASNNPSRDPQCCVGDGLSMNDGAFCGTQHQCSGGVCFLTGVDGQNCPSTGSAQPSASAPSTTAQSNSNCPATLSSCGDACYDPSLYCCPNGVLTQKQFCNNNGNAASSSTPASSSACTPVTLVRQSNCDASNPARDYTCCVGDGISVNDGAFCGTQHQCSAGYCGLTGKDGENCPYTAPGFSASSSAPARTSTPANNANCPSTLSACGEACYDPNLYCCPNGVLTQKAFCSSNGNSGSSANSGNSATSANNQPTRVNNSNCPSTLSACGDACYAPSMYCCVNGQLTQKAFCPAGAQ